MKQRSFLFLAAAPPFCGALLLFACPSLFVLWVSLLDFYLPNSVFDVHNSLAFTWYHAWLVNGLPDQEAMAAPEMDAQHPDFEKEFAQVSHDWDLPVVIRGGALGSEAYRLWHAPEFWTSNWSKEEVLAYGGKAVEFVTIGDFFKAIEKKEMPSAYIGSASSIFTRNPILERMADSPISDIIEANLPKPEGKRSIAQLFMGVGGMTTQPHCDLGANIFRQIAGRKHWFWFPQSQNALMWPKLDATGLVSTSNTHIDVSPPHGDKKESPWIRKAVRYTAILEAGDIVISPPWWWHTVTNCPHPSYCPQARCYAPSQRGKLCRERQALQHPKLCLATSDAEAKQRGKLCREATKVGSEAACRSLCDGLAGCTGISYYPTNEVDCIPFSNSNCSLRESNSDDAIHQTTTSCKASYIKGDANTNKCPNKYAAVQLEADCRSAAVHLDKNFEATENTAKWPKGCYQYKEGQFSFNKHGEGISNSQARPICTSIEVPEAPFTISVASQHGHGKSGFMSNPIWTLNGALSILRKWGSMANFEEKFNRKHLVDGRDAFERAQVATSTEYLQAARKLKTGR